MQRFLRSRCWRDVTLFLFGAQMAAACVMVFLAPWTWPDFFNHEV